MFDIAKNIALCSLASMSLTVLAACGDNNDDTDVAAVHCSITNYQQAYLQEVYLVEDIEELEMFLHRGLDLPPSLILDKADEQIAVMQKLRSCLQLESELDEALVLELKSFEFSLGEAHNMFSSIISEPEKIGIADLQVIKEQIQSRSVVER